MPITSWTKVRITLLGIADQAGTVHVLNTAAAIAFDSTWTDEQPEGIISLFPDGGDDVAYTPTKANAAFPNG